MGQSKSSTKFIAMNRKPRVHIEYAVDIGNATRMVSIPFVMGVMSDLSGKPKDELPEIADRKFVEIDAFKFDQTMKSMKPRVEFSVPNILSNDGSNLNIEMTFESMDDFSPGAVAKKVGALKNLLDTRTQLSNLLTYMGGKRQAEKYLSELLANPALLQAMASAPNTDAAPADQKKE